MLKCSIDFVREGINESQIARIQIKSGVIYYHTDLGFSKEVDFNNKKEVENLLNEFIINLSKKYRVIENLSDIQLLLKIYNKEGDVELQKTIDNSFDKGFNSLFKELT